MGISRICKVDGCGKPLHAHGYCGAHAHRFRRHGDPLGGDVPRGYVRQFFEEVVLPYDGDDCLIWPFSKDGHGYAMLGDQAVPRLICEEAHGPAPTPKHQAAHSCGHGHMACVTKGHLRWATRTENEADKLIHGTSNRGVRHGMAKLTEADVLVIRSLRGHFLQREIAEQFGIAVPTVSDIQRRKLWAWL
ncbi:MAG: hypothetical protein E5W25_23745 [Mesorhizobium sp.]|nr:MAG: hypothetical protein E5W25_23745 [Mesorhizobium sp.]